MTAAAPDWRAQARCAASDVHPDDMYPSPTDGAATQTARELCAVCPARAACLAEAMQAEYGQAVDSRWGIRGGLTQKERTDRARAAGEPVGKPVRGRKPLASCGTVAAYDRHRKRKEPICDACREARRVHQRAKAAAKRAAAACGTRTGYQRHRKAGEDACDACRAANAAADRRLRETGSTVALVGAR